MPSSVASTPTPFQEAIDFFKSKVRIPTAHWTDLWEGQHARGFVVAGAARDDLLSDFQAAILKAQEQGTTLEEFRKDFDSIVSRHGWSYNGTPGWRSRTIYHTNLRQAAMSGRWEQAMRLKSQGHKVYLRYVAIMDSRTRDQHRRWHGLVLPVDHPFWKTHHPMNGWGCRCYVQVLTDKDLKRYGYTVSPDPVVAYETRGVKTPSGVRTVKTPEGVAPGFGYNPGEAHIGQMFKDADFRDWKARNKAAGKKEWNLLTPGDWHSAGRPKVVPADATSAKLAAKAEDQGQVVEALRKVLGAEEKVFTLPDGSAMLVNAELLGAHLEPRRAAYLPFLPELLEDPFEIWMTFEQHALTGRVILRKRLVKVIDLPKQLGLILVASAERGCMTGWTFIPVKRAAYVRQFRKGKCVWGR